MSNIQTGAERMPHDLSHLGFLAGQIGRLITISTTPVIAGDSFEMDAVGALRLSPLRRGLAIDSTVDIFTFYVPHRHVYGEQWIKFMKDGVNATDRKSGSAGMPRPISYAVFCLKKKIATTPSDHVAAAVELFDSIVATICHIKIAMPIDVDGIIANELAR